MQVIPIEKLDADLSKNLEITQANNPSEYFAEYIEAQSTQVTRNNNRSYYKSQDGIPAGKAMVETIKDFVNKYSRRLHGSSYLVVKIKTDHWGDLEEIITDNNYDEETAEAIREEFTDEYQSTLLEDWWNWQTEDFTEWISQSADYEKHKNTLSLDDCGYDGDSYVTYFCACKSSNIEDHIDEIEKFLDNAHDVDIDSDHEDYKEELREVIDDCVKPEIKDANEKMLAIGWLLDQAEEHFNHLSFQEELKYHVETFVEEELNNN